MNDKEIIFGRYNASEMQLRELADTILRGDIDYAVDMLKLFENQESARLQEIERNFNAQQQHRDEVERRSDD